MATTCLIGSIHQCGAKREGKPLHSASAPPKIITVCMTFVPDISNSRDRSERIFLT